MVVVVAAAQSGGRLGIDVEMYLIRSKAETGLYQDTVPREPRSSSLRTSNARFTAKEIGILLRANVYTDRQR